MEQVKQVLNASLLWRALTAIYLWFGRQWQASGVVRWFLHPSEAGEAATQSSLLFRLWSLLWRGLYKLYALLRLDRLFHGSVFLHAAFWCALPVVLAPLLPTMAVLGLVLVGYCSLLLQLLHQGGKPLVYSPINKYLILFSGTYMAAAFLSVAPRSSLPPALLTVCFALVPLAIENSFSTRAALERLTTGIVLAGTVVAVIGIGQYLLGVTGDSAWLDSAMFSTISTRVYSTLQNPNVLSEYLLLVIPLSAALCMSRKSWEGRIFWLACCGLMLLCLVFTFARGGWLGILIAAALFVLLLEPRLLILVPAALVLLYFLMPDAVITRLTSVGNLQDGSTYYRLSIWMGSLAMLKDYWLCGIGPGTTAFNLVYPAYSYNAATAQHSHNLFLQLTADGGVCVLVLFLVTLFVLFRRACACLSKNKNSGSRLYVIAALSSLTGFLAQSMTDYTFYNYRVTLSFWAVVGLGAAWTKLCEKEGTSCSE